METRREENGSVVQDIEKAREDTTEYTCAVATTCVRCDVKSVYFVHDLDDIVSFNDVVLRKVAMLGDAKHLVTYYDVLCEECVNSGTKAVVRVSTYCRMCGYSHVFSVDSDGRDVHKDVELALKDHGWAGLRVSNPKDWNISKTDEYAIISLNTLGVCPTCVVEVADMIEVSKKYAKRQKSKWWKFSLDKE